MDCSEEINGFVMPLCRISFSMSFGNDYMYEQI